MFGRFICLSSLLILFPQIIKTTTTVYKCGSSKYFVNFLKVLNNYFIINTAIISIGYNLIILSNAFIVDTVYQYNFDAILQCFS